MAATRKSPKQAEAAEPPADHPRLTRRVVGHEAAEAAFLDAWRSGRLAHAWLISGPKGVGKATLAYRIARFVLAEGSGAGDAMLLADAQPASLDIDADHPVARRIAAGRAW